MPIRRAVTTWWSSSDRRNERKRARVAGHLGGAQGAHSSSLGFAGPVIYKTEPAAAFHDITVGGNGLYTALPGWDYVTGRGTADITNFVNGA